MGRPAMRNKDLQAIYGLVCAVCGGITSMVNEAIPEALQKEAERIAKGLYNGTITYGNIDPVMTNLVAEELRKAIIKGFGKDFPKIDFDTPDQQMLSALETNVFHFSAAENYQMIRSMSMALRDENGLLRKFKDFRDEAMKISGVYLDKNLKTEYNSAIASSQMAGKWVDFEANKKAAPYLRYDTVGDSRVRPAHRELDGIIRKVGDSFWDTYYPPNGWNCRCDVTQLNGGTETPMEKIIPPADVPEIFQTNMAKYGLAFPKDHPYYNGAPEDIMRKADRMREKRIRNWGRFNLVGKNVQVNTSIGKVGFDNSGLKELVNQPHKYKEQKDYAVYSLDKILAESRHVKSLPDVKGNLSIKMWHYFETTIKNEPSFICVREMYNGNKKVFSIVDALK
ncbi:MAG: phage head morphogenesis protein [Bacteroidota bacterium]